MGVKGKTHTWDVIAAASPIACDHAQNVSVGGVERVPQKATFHPISASLNNSLLPTCPLSLSPDPALGLGTRASTFLVTASVLTSTAQVPLRLSRQHLSLDLTLPFPLFSLFSPPSVLISTAQVPPRLSQSPSSPHIQQHISQSPRYTHTSTYSSTSTYLLPKWATQNPPSRKPSA
jgi:hypothetical protein